MVPAGQVWEDARTLWAFQLMGHDERPCSVAVGLGSHDLGVADASVELYRRGLVPLIVFTGATSDTTREVMPRGEAVHYRERARELGVPGEALLTETQARNTGENVTFTRTLLSEAGVAVESVVFVSKPYEERRAYATARKLWPGVEVTCHSAAVGFEEYLERIGDSRKVISMLVGAVQRLLVYPERGFMIEMAVPARVRTAYQRLCDAGYTSRLVTGA